MTLKKGDVKILAELIRNARVSDRRAAKKLGVSQPTVTRKRAKLEKEVIAEYTTIPNWNKLGFEILAITFARLNAAKYEEVRKKPGWRESVLKFLSEIPNIIFSSAGNGLGMSRLTISVHKNYTEYIKMRNELDRRFGFVAQTDSFIISLKGDDVIQPLSLKRFADYIEQM